MVKAIILIQHSLWHFVRDTTLQDLEVKSWNSQTQEKKKFQEFLKNQKGEL